MSPSEAQLHDALHEGQCVGLDVDALISHAVGVRRARQRRRTVVAGGLVVAGLGAAGLTTLGAPGGVSGDRASGGSAVATRNSTAGHDMRPGPLYTHLATPVHSSGMVHASGMVRRCLAGDVAVDAGAIRRGSTVYIELAMRNVTNSACSLSGYGTVEVAGRHVPRLATEVRHGDVTGHPDPGPRRVVLGSSGSSSARCYLELGGSSSRGLVQQQVRSLTIGFDGMGRPVSVDGLHDFVVGRVAGHPLPVVVTAIAP